MLRRSFLRTVSALGLALIAPVGRAFGVRQGAKLIVNGVELPLPKALDVSVHCHGPVTMDHITIRLTGAKLTVHNRDGSAFQFTCADGGYLELKGGDDGFGVCVSNENADTRDAGITVSGGGSDGRIAMCGGDTYGGV